MSMSTRPSNKVPQTSVAARAKSVAELARERAQEVARERAEEARRMQIAVEAVKARRSRETLERSPLHEWFPGETWDLMAYARRGCGVGLEVYDGSEIVVADSQRSVYLLLQPEKRRSRLEGECAATETETVAVYLVDATPSIDTDTQYAYYNGPEVKSVQQLGEFLLARDERKDKPTCSCVATHGDNPRCPIHGEVRR